MDSGVISQSSSMELHTWIFCWCSRSTGLCAQHAQHAACCPHLHTCGPALGQRPVWPVVAGPCCEQKTSMHGGLWRTARCFQLIPTDLLMWAVLGEAAPWLTLTSKVGFEGHSVPSVIGVVHSVHSGEVADLG